MHCFILSDCLILQDYNQVLFFYSGKRGKSLDLAHLRVLALSVSSA